MRDNLMMVPRLTLIIHPALKTSSGYVPKVINGLNYFEFNFDRNRLIKFFKDLIHQNPGQKISYSFNSPPAKSKHRSLADEVPITFACLLSFAEAAAYKDVPIHLYPPGISPHTIVEQLGKPLNFHDFDNIFGLQVDFKSAHEIKKKIRGVGPVSDLSYPTEFKPEKCDAETLIFTAHLNVRPVSSFGVLDLLCRGSSIMVPNENNEFVLMTMAPESYRLPHTSSRDDFGISWKTQNNESASCGSVRVPVMIDSGKIFYSKQGTTFMNVFKKEMQESSKKFAQNKSNVSSNPFHSEVKEKPAEEVQSDSEYHEVSNVQYDFPKDAPVTEQTTKASEAGPSKSASNNESSVEAPKSDGKEEPLSARQLMNFMNKFKAELKGEVVVMVEETVKKISTKDKTEGASGSKKDAEKRSVINVTDCVKSEADDSDLPKLLSTLSQIEEQLSSIENASNSDMASAKPHKYNMHAYAHGHHRRGRDFSSMTRRATLGILKKRMRGSVVELESDLCAISKSGFKLKMARNVSQSFRFVLFKYGKYRNSKFEVDFTPTIVPSGGLECCIKPATKSQDKSPIDDKGQYTFYDVRFKAKERTGKFRCYLKILRNGKVCGNPLCITVRVKRFHSASDQIDSAEEALPYPGSGGFEPTSPANVDIDEGISVFQEYPSSPSSDSEDGEAAARENDNDEGIDTKLDASCSAFEKLSMNEKRTFSSMFDEDSDSSVSLLLDENEVRESLDKDFDSVKIPACFIPHADISKEPMSVRVKRKINPARKKKSDSPSAPPKSPTKKKDWWETPVANRSQNAGPNYTADDHQRRQRESIRSFFANPSPQFFKAAKSAGNSASETETASEGPYKPLYPTLDEFLETPVKTKKPAESKETQSPVAILPEKVFEMTSNVFKSVMNSMKQPNDVKENMQKNLDETLWSISRSVFGGLNPPSAPSSQQRGTAPAASCAAPAASSAPPPAKASCTPPPASCPTSPAFCTAPPASCPMPQADCDTPPADWTSDVDDWTSDVAMGQTSSPQQPAVRPPPPASGDVPPMTGGNPPPSAPHAAPSAPAKPSAAPNTTTPVPDPIVNSSQPNWNACSSQAPKVAPSPPYLPPFSHAAFAPPPAFIPPTNHAAFAPPPAFIPPTNHAAFAGPPAFMPPTSHAAFAPPPAFIPPQSATVGTNTPNFARATRTPFYTDRARAPVKTCSAQPTNFEGLANGQMPCSAGTNVPTTNATAPPTQTPKSPQNKPSKRGMIAGEEYNRLEPEVRQKILQLNEMGFMNDNYNLFLIRKYPHDMDKVVESLVNYNDF